MQFARRPDFVTSLAFAGVLIWSGAVADPSSASERSPAASLPHAVGCAVLPPRFEPSSRRRLAPQDSNFVGGAKLRSLVAEPCLQPPHSHDV